MICGTNLRTLYVGLMKCGRVKWQEVEETRKEFNNVLIHQDRKFFISELFKVIQDAIPLPRGQDGFMLRQGWVVLRDGVGHIVVSSDEFGVVTRVAVPRVFRFRTTISGEHGDVIGVPS